MNNLSIALALILANETPNMDCAAVGDTHLPPARRAYGRMQIRKTVIDDMNAWCIGGGLLITREDSMSPRNDLLIAKIWLRRQCGDKASVNMFLRVWNGGKTGRNTPQALAYAKRCVKVKTTRPQHYWACIAEIRKAGV